MFEIRDLEAFYGKSQVLRGIDLSVGPNEIVSLLGRNGVGRSTILKSITGELRATGSIRLHDEELLGRPSHQIARRGVGYVPENRDVFPTLTVSQNLRLGAVGVRRSDGWSEERLYTLFPNLKERAQVPAGALSGGEQQMLSIGRSLMSNPRIILVDEPTEGLAPKIVSQVSELLTEIAKSGTSVLLVEQKLSIALHVSSRLYVLGKGRVVFEGTPRTLASADRVKHDWLAV
jgi:branched-chain amino acid transport system ATP-binding protein